MLRQGFRGLGVKQARRSLSCANFSIRRGFSSGSRLGEQAVPDLAVKSSRKPRSRLITPLALLGVAGSVYYVDKELYSSLGARSIRAIYVMSWIAYQYSVNSKHYNNLDDLHEITSDALLDLLMTNKGLYIKLGQAIANQGAVFPVAFQEKFPQLYQDAPQDTWSSIDRQLEKHFGKDYETRMFQYVDHVPVAGASIAQVHGAVLKSGEKVALKVQHDYIQDQIVVDLMVYKLINKMYEIVFDIPLSMFSQYISDQLIRETDFEVEASNAKRLKTIVESDSTLKNTNIYVPRTIDSLSGKQILVTEWIEGISLTDKNKLIDQGYNIRQLMTQYMQVFGKQIFKYGFIHSDPHPGNLLLRFDKSGKQQLVILDHGLYIELSDEFRTQYCQLWKYLFAVNMEGVQQITRSWGINSTGLFASMIQLKPTASITEHTHDKRNINDLFRNLIGDHSAFPQELIFVARTMRMIQNLNQQMGSPVNRINLLTKESIEALTIQNPSLGQYWDLLKIQTTLFLSNCLFYAFRLRQILSGDRYGDKGNGIEDFIEIYMQNTAKSMGFQ